MAAHRSLSTVAVMVMLILLLGGTSLTLGLAPTHTPSLATGGSAALPAAKAGLGTGRAFPTTAGHGGPVASVAGPRTPWPLVFPPNPHALAPNTPFAATTYTSSPAPMGVSDLGQRTGGAYTYGTSGFQGSLSISSYSAFTPTNVTDVGFATPNWVALQLNTVAVNVSTVGAFGAGVYWVQNGVHFNGSSLELEDNVWNFSSVGAGLPPRTLVGANGSVINREVYAGVSAPIAVSLPLTIELFNNVTTALSGHTVVRLSYVLKDPAGHSRRTYDTVTFNGTAAAGPAQFRVDGSTTTPNGLLYDAEFVMGGNGGGANENLLAFNGTERLLRWEANGSTYRATPAAYDFGPDSSETALGVAVAYTGTTVHLSQGPSFVWGLWNTTSSPLAPAAAPGWIKIRLNVSPSYAIVFATNQTASSLSLARANYSYAPSDRAGALTTELPPPPGGNPYVFSAWAAGSASASFTVGTNATATSPGSLTLSPSAGPLNAPVYLLGTTQARSFGAAHITGVGYAAGAGELWLNRSTDALVAPFLRVNDLGYPTFELAAVAGLNVSLTFNRFTQAPSTFNYTSESGRVSFVPFFTQGYFFYGGIGRFTVENTTIQGSPALAHAAPPTFPPATIQFSRVASPKVANLTASDEAVGVRCFSCSLLQVSHLQALAGGLGLSTYATTGLTLASASSSGLDAVYHVHATLANLNRTTAVNVRNVTAAASSWGFVTRSVTGFNVTNFTVTGNAQGFSSNYTNTSVVRDLSVGGGTGSYGGNWTFSNHLTFLTVTVVAIGLDLLYDSLVTVRNGTAIGFDSAVIDSFLGSTGATVNNLRADQGAAGAIFVCPPSSPCSDLTLTGITAVNGSAGAIVQGASTVAASKVTSSNLSVGLLVNSTTGDTFSQITTGDMSLGLFVQNSTPVTVTGVVATNSVLPPKQYFSNASALAAYPSAGVGLVNDTTVTVMGVTADYYPFAVWVNNSAGVTVKTVTDLYGYEAIAFNRTNGSTVSFVFAFSNFRAVSLENCTGDTVQESTLELSQKQGVGIWNGSTDTIQDNNFVGNNGSATNGAFSLVHDQAVAVWYTSIGASRPTFRSNFWADHSGTGAYTINSTALLKDASVQTSFYGTYLEFLAKGLPAGKGWQVGVISATFVTTFATNVTELFLPGWGMANGLVVWAVTPVPGYPAHPVGGNLTWAGASLTQPIQFGNPPSGKPAGIPIWVFSVIGVVAGVGLLTAALILSRRDRRRPPTVAGRQAGPARPGGRAQGPGSRDSDWSPEDPS